MHDAAYQFIRDHITRRDLLGSTVVEVGSYNVNGSIRPLFTAADRYIGLDRRNGPGVDSVTTVQAYAPLHPASCDIVVSCEALEHDPDPEGHIQAAMALLSPGGLLLLTAAAPERAPHGNDGGGVGPDEYYGGIDPKLLGHWVAVAGGVDVHVTHDSALGDVYVSARKGVAL